MFETRLPKGKAQTLERNSMETSIAAMNWTFSDNLLFVCQFPYYCAPTLLNVYPTITFITKLVALETIVY